MIVIGSDEVHVDLLKTTFGCFPSGVTAMCAMIDGSPVGMAASSFTSVSLSPPLISICIANSSTTWPLLRSASHLGLSILGAEHEGAARQLASKSRDRFTGLGTDTAESGAIFLEGSSAWLECSVYEEIAAGDHALLLLKVSGVLPFPHVSPLVFHGSAFRQMGS